MKHWVCVGLVLIMGFSVSSSARAETDLSGVVKTIKKMIAYIRYGKDQKALDYLDTRWISRQLLSPTEDYPTDTWKDMTEEQRTEFVDGVRFIFKNLSFPKFREEYFDYLDAILYEDPRLKESSEELEAATVQSTIVIYRDLKKQEIVVNYTLLRGADDTWRVADVAMEGESVVETNREEVVEILQDGGIPLLMKRLREKIADIKENMDD